MSISSAMTAGVSGLFANSASVEKISENIANAQTVGYRRNFTQMVTTSTGAGGGGGVRAEALTDMDSSGGLKSTGAPFDMGISGEGFFVVSKEPNDPNMGNYRLTRAGSFRPDENGNLRNTAGYYLAGWDYDPDGTLGVIDQNSFAQMSTVNVDALGMAAEATTQMSVRGNLPAQETGTATPGASFTASGGYHTALGEAGRLNLDWAPSTNANEWTLTMSQGGVDYGRVDVTFADAGPGAGGPASYGNVTDLTGGTGGFAFDTGTGTASITLDNGGTPQTIDLALGAPGSLEGITQFAGDFTPQKFTADGSPVAEVARTEISESGDVYAIYDNGQRQPAYRVPLAMVANPSGLKADDGNAFRLGADSGELSIHNPGRGAGTVSSGVLEESTVDIAQELTDMIQVQRAYSSNAKIITTADQMLEETTRLKR